MLDLFRLETTRELRSSMFRDSAPNIFGLTLIACDRYITCKHTLKVLEVYIGDFRLVITTSEDDCWGIEIFVGVNEAVRFFLR